MNKYFKGFLVGLSTALLLLTIILSMLFHYQEERCPEGYKCEKIQQQKICYQVEGDFLEITNIKLLGISPRELMIELQYKNGTEIPRCEE